MPPRTKKRHLSVALGVLVLVLGIVLSARLFREHYWMNRVLNIAEKYTDRAQSFLNQQVQPVHFRPSKIPGFPVERPTSLQFGPDNKLYVAAQRGMIYRLTLDRNSAGQYTVLDIDTIDLVRQIPNHRDDGVVDTAVHDRQVTGLLVTGTANAPVLYVSSSDPRIGGLVDGSTTSADGDLGLDTNSGMISRLNWNGIQWTRTDLVRGLPRSEENHSVNGLALDTVQQVLYVACGGNTNAGGPSKAYGLLSEYALSSAILKVDLQQLSTMPVKTDAAGTYVYDLPTLDDPTRSNLPDGSDPGDPFGGNDGLNQARLIPGSPVEVFSPGYRNPYDLVLVQPDDSTLRLYTIDNGANPGLGGYPDQEGNPGVTNKYLENEPGSVSKGTHDFAVNNLDNLHLVYQTGMKHPVYGGHPNPIRANPATAGWLWSDTQVHYDQKPTRDWPPVPISIADPQQSDFRNPGVNDGALTIFYGSTNGIAVYSSSRYFNGSLRGDLVAASFNGSIERIRLTEDGSRVRYKESLAKGFGTIPLDLTCQGDFGIFPGTIWVADFGGNAIYVLEPTESPSWSTIPHEGSVHPQARHESAFVECQGQFYLLGGRGQRGIDRLDPRTGRWSPVADIPGNQELNHFQAVAIDQFIYIVGAFTGDFPDEKAVPDIYRYDTQLDQWTVIPNAIPVSRRRGSMAAAVHAGKIYLVGGNTRGHRDGAVSWADCYDPQTGNWSILPDAPHRRDHFQSTIAGGKLYALGGRRTQAGTDKLFSDTEAAVDIYDLATGKWTTLPDAQGLPTPRAGAATVQAGSLILVIGGESKEPKAHDDVEAFNLETQAWQVLPKLREGRHGTQAIAIRNTVYIAGGCARQGGSPEINSLESIDLTPFQPH